MNILAISRLLPFPLDQGEAIRTFYFHRELAERHQVYLVVLNHFGDPLPVPLPLCEIYKEILQIPHRRNAVVKSVDLVNAMVGKVPYGVRANTSTQLKAQFREILSRWNIDIVLLQSLAVSNNVRDLLCPVVLDAHNWEGLLSKRIFEVERNPLKRFFYARECRNTYNFERDVAKAVSGVISVSPHECRYFSRMSPTIMVPNGIPGADKRVSARPCESRPPTVLFTGLLRYPPNRDAVQFLLTEIWPEICRMHPSARLQIVARKPPAFLRKLATDRVEFCTDVADINPVFDTASVLVAPLRSGAGSRLKLLQAFAAGLPVVSTTIGAEGLDVTDGEHLLIADSAKEFANAVIRLLGNPTFAQELSSRSQAFVDRAYSWKKLTEPCEAFFQSLVKETSCES